MLVDANTLQLVWEQERSRSDAMARQAPVGWDARVGTPRTRRSARAGIARVLATMTRLLASASAPMGDGVAGRSRAADEACPTAPNVASPVLRRP